MSYLDLINAFDKWSRMNYLAPQARVLYYKFLALFNAYGWPEWITVGNPQLVAEAQIGNEKTTLLHRDKLISAGLLDYQKGKKGAPNKYRLKTAPFTVKNTAKSTVKATVNPTVKATAIPRYKTKDLREDISNEISSHACGAEDGRNSIAELEKTFESLIGPITQKAKRGLAQAAKELGYERVEEAIFIAADNNAESWDYVEKTIETLRLHPEKHWETP